MMRGHRKSECFVPREYEGGLRLTAVTFSGLWAPGPGFLVASMNIKKCIAIVHTYSALCYISIEGDEF